MTLLGESTAADWDTSQAEQGVHHETDADTDFGPADEVEKGYATGLSGLQHYFPLQEDSGVANDIIGGGTSTDNDNHPNQGVSGILGNNATEFDASNSEGLRFGTEGRYANVTALAWVTWSSPGNFSAIVGNLSGFSSSDDGWAVRTESTAGELSVDLFASGGTRAQATGGSINDGNWHLVGLRWDGADLDLLIDGSVAATDGTQSGNADYTNAMDLRIGRNPAGGNFWGGKINHVLIFNTAISDAFHTDLYDTVAGTSEYWADKKVS